MNIRTLRILVLAGVLGAFAVETKAQIPRCAEIRDPLLISAPKTSVVVNGFPFEFRPKAYELYLENPGLFESLAGAINIFGPLVSYENRIERFWVGDPGEVCGGSTIRFLHTMTFGYEDATFLKDKPDLQRKHMLQIFLHEFGHAVAREGNSLAAVEPIYWKAFLATPQLNVEIHPLFVLFMDYTYEKISDGCGHPNNNADELFASSFMITLMYPKELKQRIAQAPKHVKEPAQQLLALMQKVTARYPHPQTLLAKPPLQAHATR